MIHQKKLVTNIETKKDGQKRISRLKSSGEVIM